MSVLCFSHRFVAVFVAGTASWYFARSRRRIVDTSSSGAQTRNHVALESSTDGRRVYHVGKLEFYPDAILGYGSAGTIVYEGRFDGRKVAVKRLVPELCGLAEREAQLLRLSDNHSNVIRYFLTEYDSHFCYLALELAAGTLADYIENKQKICAETFPLKPLAIIEQALTGLNHLHGLGIVHRDLKPANVLLSMPETGAPGNSNGSEPKVRAIISDFGLCKRISHSSSWVAKSSSIGRTIGGTEGWIAPEILLHAFPQEKNNVGGENGNDDDDDDKVYYNKTRENSSHSPVVTPAVDIFSAGCLIYYALTNGKHPFGEPLRRQVNIQCGKADYFELQQRSSHTAKDLCEWMVSADPSRRPSVNDCLAHPLFWQPAKQLAFLLDVSDRLEKVQPGDGCPALTNLERGASYIVNYDWRRHVGQELQAELRTHRSYRGSSVRDLLRAIRNKKHHYQELPEAVKLALGEIPDGFLQFFTGRFPRLLIHAYRAASCIGDEPPLSGYYNKMPSTTSAPQLSAMAGPPGRVVNSAKNSASTASMKTSMSTPTITAGGENRKNGGEEEEIDEENSIVGDDFSTFVAENDADAVDDDYDRKNIAVEISPSPQRKAKNYKILKKRRKQHENKNRMVDQDEPSIVKAANDPP